MREKKAIPLRGIKRPKALKTRAQPLLFNTGAIVLEKMNSTKSLKLKGKIKLKK